MVKLSALTLCALLSFCVLADAGNATAPANISCDQDPRCYARDLALTLTSAQESLVLQRVVDFNPGSVRVYSKSRERIQAIADQWKQRSDWAVITVNGYSGASARSRTDTIALGQRRADKIRGYFIRYGVPAEYVVAIGHDAAPGSAAAAVDLSIALCSRASKCARDAVAVAP
jgi:outer membrane protein OmpA-like peptidoglycan-associated protein